MQRTTLRQQAYRRLRNKFLSGELVAGMALSENQLAKELGMSRTPIREAIRQMEMEGLLDYAPRCGAMVRMPDVRQLTEMYSVREALESHAAAMAARRISSEVIGKLDGLLKIMEAVRLDFLQSGESHLEGERLRRYLEADLEFHRVVVDAAGNRYLSKLVDDTRLLVRVFTATFWRYDRGKLDESNRFHKRLLDALRSNDAEAARVVTIQAMQVARENAVEAFGRQEGGADDLHADPFHP